jgi:hypothetical protein
VYIPSSSDVPAYNQCVPATCVIERKEANSGFPFIDASNIMPSYSMSPVQQSCSQQQQEHCSRQWSQSNLRNDLHQFRQMQQQNCQYDQYLQQPTDHSLPVPPHRVIVPASCSNQMPEDSVAAQWSNHGVYQCGSYNYLLPSFNTQDNAMSSVMQNGCVESNSFSPLVSVANFKIETMHTPTMMSSYCATMGSKQKLDYAVQKPTGFSQIANPSPGSHSAYNFFECASAKQWLGEPQPLNWFRSGDQHVQYPGNNMSIPTCRPEHVQTSVAFKWQPSADSAAMIPDIECSSSAINGLQMWTASCQRNIRQQSRDISLPGVISGESSMEYLNSNTVNETGIPGMFAHQGNMCSSVLPSKGPENTEYFRKDFRY